MLRRLLATSLFAVIPAVGPVSAGEHARQMGAHVHGHGQLNIAIDDRQLLIELEAPGADIVGFEHAARTDAEKAAVADAVALLRQPLKLFVLPGAAGCVLREAEVALAGDEHDDHDDHDDHAKHDDDEKHDDHAKHDDDEHHKDDDDHDHAKHDDDDDKHDDHAKHDDDEHRHGDAHDDDSEEVHGEFHAEYVLACQEPAAITSIRFAYFERFPRAEELDVSLVTAAGQYSFEVERDAPVLRLEGVM